MPFALSLILCVAPCHGESYAPSSASAIKRRNQERRYTTISDWRILKQISKKKRGTRIRRNDFAWFWLELDEVMDFPSFVGEKSIWYLMLEGRGGYPMTFFRGAIAIDSCPLFWIFCFSDAGIDAIEILVEDGLLTGLWGFKRCNWCFVDS